MKKKLLMLAILANSLFAHTAIMNCFDNGDETITCEAGFSDGSTASGVNFYVEQDGKKLLVDKFPESSEITFKKFPGVYNVVFDGGEGHKVSIKSSSINE